MESLKNSDIRGIRYLNDRERAKLRERKEFEEFDRKIKSMVAKAAKEREEERRLSRDLSANSESSGS